jgi:hypothetical protein
MAETVTEDHTEDHHEEDVSAHAAENEEAADGMELLWTWTRIPPFRQV